MDIRLSFFGAAQTVTGSRYILEANGMRILIDCGMYQERDYRYRNWAPFHRDPDSIDAMLLTHAHLDHSGMIPRLVSQGFSGPIHCTAATAKIATIIMADSAKIMAEDVAFKKRRHERAGRKSPHSYDPLYDREDVEKTVRLFRHAGMDKTIDLGGGITATFCEAGHILGSTHILITVKQGDEERTILFSGDIGRWGAPILRDPTPFADADYVVVESTYGNREHEDNSHIRGQLAAIINETCEAGGNVIIPSFAVERSQELLYHLNALNNAKEIPKLMCFVDSPMAIRVTDVFRSHSELYDDDARRLVDSGDDPCDFEGLHMCRTATQSKAINQIRGTALVIAGSGMCTGGRIKHHLVRNIERPESTVLFVGYQAVGTLGRQILEGEDRVRINGEIRTVKARVERINGFSGHGDRNELMRWMKGLQNPPKRVFVTHGEIKAADAFAESLRSQLGYDAVVPAYEDEFTLD